MSLPRCLHVLAFGLVLLWSTRSMAEEPASDAVAASSEATQPSTLNTPDAAQPSDLINRLSTPGRIHGYYSASFAIRLNPLGVFLGGSLLARTRLYMSDSAALKDNYFAAGALVFLTP